MVAQLRDYAPESMTRTEFADQVLAWLDEMNRTVAEHLTAHRTRAAHYSTGIPVSSVVDVTAAGHRYEKVWHPVPSHESNQPRRLANGADFGDGTTIDVLVSAPGVLDVVRRSFPNVV
ncbi:hypothetical protein P6281_06615 [Mycobacterium sp. 5-140-3-2]|uniref:hypothetical protein n=1 Tax=unclassified Mycobacterium TaxID=2642494 RepID=UPI002D797E0C|nr:MULTISPECIES: hypothetical protein [unclassified Mycobacterium]WRU83591.1 hypothetical protein P6281_06615 [Mycobacterium sp. 5-140-3-2]WSE40263.1 hypothetical protein QGN28_19500 [Mycobacterium sp. 5-140-3-1]